MMKTLVILAGALALTACATTGDNTAPAPAGFDASASQFEGWARVSDGEIQLFAQQRDLSRGFPTDCVSGALPRNLQRTATDISGTKIRLSGRTMAWAERNGAQTHDWQGSNISNQCRRDVVILADRVEVLRRRPVTDRPV